jgi:predicted dehydrogenase
VRSLSLRAVLVGYGYWGPNLLRNLVSNQSFDVIGVIDSKTERLQDAKRISPRSAILGTYENLEPDSYDCAFIATPPETHFEIASYFIKLGKHVWIEKPAVKSMSEYTELSRVAKENGVKVFVDHTFIFSPSVRELKRRIEGGDFGQILHVNSFRANLGIFQTEVDALSDLAIHDLAIIDYLFPKLAPLWVINLGFDPFNNGQDSINSLIIQYEGGLSAAIQVNWISPVKKREFFVIGQKQAASYDETDQNHKLKVFQQEFDILNGDYEDDISKKTMFLTSYKTGDVTIPKLENHEALKIGVKEFAECILAGSAHSCEIGQIKQIMVILEAATKSAKSGGVKIHL